MTVPSGQKIAYLFPGQGSQAVGMGKELFSASAASRAVFDEVDDALGLKLSSIMFEGPAEALTRTENAQPAIAAVSLAAWKALEETSGSPRVPDMAAGHSLGEYTALAVAGVLSISDVVRLVSQRGRVMQGACDERPGGMAALIGIDEITVEEICRETGAYTSNINAPGQIIISGSHMDLARAIDLAAARGARKAIPLSVAGAFHSGLMAPAQHELNHLIDSLEFSDPVIPIVGNVEARPLNTAAEIKEELQMQLMSCVQWNRTMDFMLQSGVRDYVELGPGRVLGGIMKRIDRKASVTSIGDYEGVCAYAAA